ncbi:LacI family DNA-binding transcriptional regulator [Lewinella sp. IMCC34183]|uniref:LacI family DNA-binding transcriptional regulator n=1 Tax=Lewinella sp. IMCC34183 TaxID=2248762 RepID=UPI000E22A2BC|nr:LacI family DNA-binding transcriptional regulator [Lewinella sp. IMCC34183]
MKKKAVTIYDIAQRLNISPSTVSRGLRNDERINKETRRLISKTARELNYHPNRVAAGLRGGATGTIGVIVPRISRSFFATAISAIQRVARSRGLQVIITQSDERLEREMESVAALTSARVDGIIASISEETAQTTHFQELLRRQFPLVFFDRVVQDVPVHRVVLDDFQSARRAVAHLVEGGASRIAYFGGSQNLNVYRDRYAGYRSALAEAGLSQVDAFVNHNCLTEERGAEELAKMFTHANPPDAVLATSDFVALGVLTYCRERGISIPEQMRVVGFANEPFTRLTEPALSSVEQFSDRMGTLAAELLLRLIDDGEKLPGFQEIVVSGELKIRTSSLVHAAATTNKT